MGAGAEGQPHRHPRPAEAARLNDWFVSIGLGYGDQVAIVNDGYYGPALREGIANVVARHGLLVARLCSFLRQRPPDGQVAQAGAAALGAG